jgi:hypothetical protein
LAAAKAQRAEAANEDHTLDTDSDSTTTEDTATESTATENTAT